MGLFGRETEEFANGGFGFAASFLEVVVDDDQVEMMFEGDFVRSFVDAGQKALDRFGPAHFQPAAQLVDGGRFDKKGEGGMRILLTDMDSTFDLDIEQGG